MCVVLVCGAAVLPAVSVVRAQPDEVEEQADQSEGFNPETIEGFSTEMEEIIGDQPLEQHVVQHVVQPETPEGENAGGSLIYWIAGGGAVVLLAGVLGYVLMKKRSGTVTSAKK